MVCMSRLLSKNTEKHVGPHTQGTKCTTSASSDRINVRKRERSACLAASIHYDATTDRLLFVTMIYLLPLSTPW